MTRQHFSHGEFVLELMINSHSLVLEVDLIHTRHLNLDMTGLDFGSHSKT